ncbi:MAG: FG-GAP repeat domain-containing protein [Candidatus Methylacidiphilales bacterium]|nr:VCBS repeat-containing protein [Candidatus Methylacidiphilales bacterium]
MVNGTRTEPSGFVVTDLNKDERDDILALSEGEAIEILINQEDGSFTSNGILRVNPEALRGNPVIEDVNGDGNLDIVALSSSETTCSIRVFPGSGTGTFTMPVIATPCDADEIRLGDFTGDGISDILAIKRDKSTVMRDSSVLSVLPGKGDGTFGQPIAGPEDLKGLALLTVADFNKDGKLDVAVGEDLTEPIRVFLGNGNGSLNVTTTPALRSLSKTAAGPGASADIADPVFAIASQDMNSDGKPDLVLGGASDFWVMLGKGDGTFHSAMSNAGITYNLLLTQDLNCDGIPDLLINNNLRGASDRLLFYKGERNGSLAPFWEMNIQSLQQYLPQSTASAARARYVRASWGRSTPRMATSPYNFEYSGSNPHYVVAGDFNGDKRQDLAFLGQNLSQTRQKILILDNLTGVPVYQRYSVGVYIFGALSLIFVGAAAAFCLWFFKPPPVVAGGGETSTHVPFPVTPRPPPSRFT